MTDRESKTASSVQFGSPWPKDALRIGFGVVWAIDAALKWTPGFRANYMSMIMNEVKGQPGWLNWWLDFWIRLQHPQAAFFSYLVAAVETLIALGLILGFARKLTYIGATILSFLIWSTVEGFGGPYTAGSTDIGTSIIYVMVFLGLIALDYYSGPDRYSVDNYLEHRVSWWWRVAEIRRPTATEPVAAKTEVTPSLVSASASALEMKITEESPIDA
ncbi:MAG: DoxX family protein [Acidimicrobiaceae bacterium]|nr:DoxX family protein [Acidimicrobiaceae bacterium]